MPWNIVVEPVEPSTCALRVSRDGEASSFGDVLRGLLDDSTLRRSFAAALADAPYAGYFWECVPLTRLSQPFECVLVDSAAVAGLVADPTPFATPFASSDADSSVATFENLGGDAVLVAPRPLASDVDYVHLAAFVRGAPKEQVHALLAAVADAVVERGWRRVGAPGPSQPMASSDVVELAAKVGLATKPIWISTSGLGVSWLHVRIDDRPKYYTHTPYRDVPRRHRR